MYNELLHIGPVTVYGYGLMIGIGILAAYFTAEYRAKKNGLDPERILGFIMSCIIFGFLGSKCLYFITVFDEIIADPSKILDLSSGWVVFGGIIGGIGGAAIYCKVKKLSLLDYMDNGFPSVALAQGFGRIGCFLAGCCYGIQCESPVSITFTHSDFAPNNVPLIPTQLISAAADFAHFFILLALAKKFKKRGQIASAYLVFYSIGRFILEYYRGDLMRGTVGTLSTSQFIAIFTFVAGLAGFIFAQLHKEKVEVETTEETSEETAE